MRFSRKSSGSYANTANLAGGPAYLQSPRLELVSLVLATFLKDSCYESANETLNRLVRLVRSEDPRFAAKLALFARNECGMRSVSHVIAAETAKRVKGEAWVRRFLERVVKRPDDAVEILAYYVRMHGKPIPNALKKGLGAAIAKFDDYQLAKHRCEGQEFTLVDLVNLVHPVPTAKNARALAELVKGTLKAFDTWEVELTRAGQGRSWKEAIAAKQQAWKRLVTERRLGMLALVKNLRNLVEQADLETVAAAAETLRDREAIRRSLVLPFRFVDASRALEPENWRSSDMFGLPAWFRGTSPKGVSVFLDPDTGEVIIDESEAIDRARAKKEQADKRQTLVAAIHEATENALANVPKLDGKTVIMLDCSGSMIGRPYEIGATFAAALARTNDARVILFDTQAKYLDMASGPKDTIGFVKEMMRLCTGGGTDFDCPFKLLEREGASYDRIVIFSDMQAWVSDHACAREYRRYVERVGGKPKLYSFDLTGYGTMQFPEKSVYCIAGWSEKTLELMGLLDGDIDALAHRIEAVELEPAAKNGNG